MKSLFTNIESMINDTIFTFIKNVSEKHDIEYQELLDMWNSDNTKEKKSSKSESPGTSDSTCPYIYKKGAKEGEKCGCKALNGLYCSKHKKQEGIEPKEKKTLPPTIKKTMNNSMNTAKTQSKNNTNNIILRYHKEIKELLHNETGFVFNKSREVFGKLLNDKIVDLDDNDIDIAKSRCFKICDSKKKPKKDDNDSDDEEKTKPIKKSKKSPKKSKKQVKQDDDTDDDNEDNPIKQTSKKPVSQSDDSDDGDMSKLVKKQINQSDNSDDDDESTNKIRNSKNFRDVDETLDKIQKKIPDKNKTTKNEEEYTSEDINEDDLFGNSDDEDQEQKHNSDPDIEEED